MNEETKALARKILASECPDGVPAEWLESFGIKAGGGEVVDSSAESNSSRDPSPKGGPVVAKNKSSQGVFGEGKTNEPLIAFVAKVEPGEGGPFVAEAGELLHAAITKGLGVSIEDVYICGFSSGATEALAKHLKAIQPKVIVSLGEMDGALGIDDSSTLPRGTWSEWQGVFVMPTLSPEFVCANPGSKREFWNHLKLVISKLGLA